MLLMGGERAPVLVLGLFGASILLSFIRNFSVPTLAVAVIAWSAGMYLLRQMAKSDPQMLRIAIKHMKYKNFYGARSTPWIED